MESLLSFGQDTLIVLAGLFLRFLAAVVVLAVVLVPILLVVAGWQRIGALRDRATGLGTAGTLKWMRNAYYAPWHTWLAPTAAGLARVGLDGIAERLLMTVTSVEIAAPGSRLRAGEPLARIASGDRVATLRAPADTMIVATNREIAAHPELLHRDPYHRGWLALVSSSSDAYKPLRSGELAHEWLENEDRRLRQAFEHTLGYAAADGGDFVGPTSRLLSREQWNQLVDQFL
jgi:glycine cleavage system H protein